MSLASLKWRQTLYLCNCPFIPVSRLSPDKLRTLSPSPTPRQRTRSSTHGQTTRSTRARAEAGEGGGGGGGWRNRTRRWPRCRPPRIFLSIANESSPVILISGGPPGIVIHRIIAIVGWNRRNGSARSADLRTGPRRRTVCASICAEGRKEGWLKRIICEGGGGRSFL